MPLINSLRRTAVLFALASAIAPTLAPALADVIIIRANGPSAARYAAGRTLLDAARVVLLRGDQLVLLDAHGTRTVSGPGSFPAAGTAVAASSSRLLALATNTADRRNRVGAVRNLPTDAARLRPNIFLVDVAAPGNVCIVDPAGVSVWRAMADTPATTIIGGAGATATVSWIKGQSTQPWPVSLPIATGSSYRLTQTGQLPPAAMPPATTTTPVTVSFQLLAAPPTDLPQLAMALIAHRCTAQIDVMVATTTPAGR